MRKSVLKIFFCQRLLIISLFFFLSFFGGGKGNESRHIFVCFLFFLPLISSFLFPVRLPSGPIPLRSDPPLWKQTIQPPALPCPSPTRSPILFHKGHVWTTSQTWITHTRPRPRLRPRPRPRPRPRHNCVTHDHNQSSPSSIK